MSQEERWAKRPAHPTIAGTNDAQMSRRSAIALAIAVSEIAKAIALLPTCLILNG